MPPHERTWRHPSEIAAAERALLRAETAPSSTRAFALTTGTLGLLAVGVLVLTVTPRRGEAPVAVSATTTPVVAAAAPTVAASTIAALRPSGARSQLGSTRRVFTGSARPLATPIGDGHLALVTHAALTGSIAGPLEVRLPSGRLGTGRVVAVVDEAVLVELDRAERGHAVAEHLPHERDIVTVLSSPPVTIAFADVASLDVDEGTAVLDATGELVGLCSDDDGGTDLIEVRSDLVDATSDDP
jgi:hypothetical protein